MNTKLDIPEDLHIFITPAYFSFLSDSVLSFVLSTGWVIQTKLYYPCQTKIKIYIPTATYLPSSSIMALMTIPYTINTCVPINTATPTTRTKTTLYDTRYLYTDNLPVLKLPIFLF